MELGLKKKVDAFYKEASDDESFRIGSMARSLVPKLVAKIEELEKRIDNLTSDCSSEDAEQPQQISNVGTHVEELMKDNQQMKAIVMVFVNTFKKQVEDFKSVDPEDGEHTLHVSHEELMKMSDALQDLIDKYGK